MNELITTVRHTLLDNDIINVTLQEDVCQFPCAIENIEILAGHDEIDGHDIWLNYEDWCKVNS